jgi:hypothetical protein
VTGLNSAAVEEVTRGTCRWPDTAGIAHNLRTAGYGVIHRWLRRNGTENLSSLEVPPTAVSEVVRSDLRRLAAEDSVRRVVVPLDPALEPAPICVQLDDAAAAGTTVAGQLDVRGVLTVVDEARWLDDAAGTNLLAQRRLGRWHVSAGTPASATARRSS